MPAALLRPCAWPGGCPHLVEQGCCAEHARPREEHRGSASSRGYDSRHWVPFTRRFRQMLIAAGITPVCGAALPGGPAMTMSRCRAEGRLEGRTQVHHEPPLTREERKDWRVVCDPLRVGLLCASCHSIETGRR